MWENNFYGAVNGPFKSPEFILMKVIHSVSYGSQYGLNITQKC